MLQWLPIILSSFYVYLSHVFHENNYFPNTATTLYLIYKIYYKIHSIYLSIRVQSSKIVTYIDPLFIYKDTQLDPFDKLLL